MRWATDFGEVVRRGAWEQQTKARHAAALQEKTLRAALPDTRWPVVQLRLKLEVDEPPEVCQIV